MPVTPRNTLGKTCEGSRRNKVGPGQVFGRLQVISLAGANRMWRCTCQCGATAIVQGAHLNSGHSKSCGCLKREVSSANRVAALTVHGMSKTPTWNTWRSMHKRCLYSDFIGYALYGGRGISVCPEWGLFETFYRDMGARPPGKSLDRIDTNGNYEPGNCRWATPAEQGQNRRNNKLCWDVVREIRSSNDTYTQLAIRFGVSWGLIKQVRINAIWVDDTYLPGTNRD